MDTQSTTVALVGLLAGRLRLRLSKCAIRDSHVDGAGRAISQTCCGDCGSVELARRSFFGAWLAGASVALAKTDMA